MRHEMKFGSRMNVLPLVQWLIPKILIFSCVRYVTWDEIWFEKWSARIIKWLIHFLNAPTRTLLLSFLFFFQFRRTHAAFLQSVSVTLLQLPKVVLFCRALHLGAGTNVGTVDKIFRETSPMRFFLNTFVWQIRSAEHVYVHVISKRFTVCACLVQTGS